MYNLVSESKNPTLKGGGSLIVNVQPETFMLKKDNSVTTYRADYQSKIGLPNNFLTKRVD